ncbi:MAG: hypothetical protein U1E91_06010 [Moraxella sp.]
MQITPLIDASNIMVMPNDHEAILENVTPATDNLAHGSTNGVIGAAHFAKKSPYFSIAN